MDRIIVDTSIFLQNPGNACEQGVLKIQDRWKNIITPRVTPIKRQWPESGLDARLAGSAVAVREISNATMAIPVRNSLNKIQRSYSEKVTECFLDVWIAAGE